MSEKYRGKYRNESIRLKNWDYGSNASYFITICTSNRVNYFGEIKNGKMQVSPAGAIAHVLWFEIKHHAKNIELGEFVVMPNHIHGILTLNDTQPIINGLNGDFLLKDIFRDFDGDIGDIGRDVACNVPTCNIPNPNNDSTQNIDSIPNNNDLISQNNIPIPNNHSIPNPIIDLEGDYADNGGYIGTDVACNVPTGNVPTTNVPTTKNEQMAAISPKANTVSSIMRSYKSAVTKYCNRLELPMRWQSRFYDHIIRNDKSYNRISEYIQNNPSNWKDDTLKT